jgi:acetyltransferase-like isoleucine patch superfamily enzyme
MFKWLYRVKRRNGYIYTRILFFRFKKKDEAWGMRHVELKSMPTHFQAFSPGMPHVGKWSYASESDFRVAYPESKIGSFCSIGRGCVLGCGYHPTHFLSTSPYFYFDALSWKDKEAPSHNEFWKNDPVELGHDVWLGENVFVMNGVKIGTGAVVGTGSIVTKDVPPYAIVAGVPARIIRMRFSPEIIEKLLASKWWELEDDVIRKIPYDNIEQAIEFLENLKK